MRIIRTSSVFKRDYKRIKATPRYAREIDRLLTQVLDLLCADEALPERHRDHVLIGNWRGFRECHLRPDLLLIYRLSKEAEEVQLARLGTHTDLFGWIPIANTGQAEEHIINSADIL